MTNTQATYTLAFRNAPGDFFQPIPGIPQDMTKQQAESHANVARQGGFDVVAFNCKAC